MKMIASFYKHNDIRFVSHLDMQRLLQRAFRRADLPLAYSKGFNPHPLLSFATALSVGYTSDSEYFEIELTEKLQPEYFMEKVNSVLPEGVKIISAFDASETKTSLTALMRSAEYTVKLDFNEKPDTETLQAAADKLMNGEINVMKKTKGGIKPVNIRPYVLKFNVLPQKENKVFLNITGVLTASGGLPVELLLDAFYELVGQKPSADVNRDKIIMDWAALK